MNRFSLEVKVGIVVTLTVALILAFLFFLSGYNPFAKSYRVNVVYNFAGGIEVGSPVRVAGIKVGKVEKVLFLEPGYSFQGEKVCVSLSLLLDKRAKHMIREDSKFYINMAGIIGEKYIEILPGTSSSKELKDGATVRGIDPPRIEQLLSQGYGFFEELAKLVKDVRLKDQEKLTRLFKDLLELAENLSEISKKLNEIAPAFEKTPQLINEATALTAEMKKIVELTSPKTQKEKKEFESAIKKLPKTLEHLSSVIEKIDKISTKLEGRADELNRTELERLLRQIFQQEGVTINVGTVIKKPTYPPPPKKKETKTQP